MTRKHTLLLAAGTETNVIFLLVPAQSLFSLKLTKDTRLSNSTFVLLGLRTYEFRFIIRGDYKRIKLFTYTQVQYRYNTKATHM